MFFINPSKPVLAQTNYNQSDPDSSKVLTLYDISKGQPQKTASLNHSAKITFLHGNRDYLLIAYHTEENDFLARGSVALYHWEDLSLYKTIDVGKIWFQTIALSPDSQWICVSSAAENILIFDVEQSKLVQETDAGEFVSGAAFSPDSLTLMAISTFQGAGYLNHFCYKDKRWHETEINSHDPNLQTEGLPSVMGTISFSQNSDLALVSISDCDYPKYDDWWADIYLINVKQAEIITVIPIREDKTGIKESTREKSIYQPNAVFSLDEDNMIVGTINDFCLVIEIETQKVIEKVIMPQKGRSIALESSCGTLWSETTLKLELISTKVKSA